MIARYRRPALVALFALAVLLAGVWTDLLVDGRTDLLRDLLSTGIALVFGLIVGDTALTVEERIGRRPKSTPLYALRVMGMSALWVWLGHALMPALAMLVQIPRTGFDILPTIALGIEFILRQSFLPCLVLGALVGLAVVLVSHKNATHSELVEEQSASQISNPKS
jgi:hypothetical protein